MFRCVAPIRVRVLEKFPQAYIQYRGWTRPSVPRFPVPGIPEGRGSAHDKRRGWGLTFLHPESPYPESTKRAEGQTNFPLRGAFTRRRSKFPPRCALPLLGVEVKMFVRCTRRRSKIFPGCAASILRGEVKTFFPCAGPILEERKIFFR